MSNTDENVSNMDENLSKEFGSLKKYRNVVMKNSQIYTQGRAAPIDSSNLR